RSERRSLRGSEGELGAGLCWRLAQARRRPSGYGEAAFATMGAWMGACPAEAGVACEGWWSQAGSNRRPRHCERRALPAELWPRRDRPRDDPNRSTIGAIYSPAQGQVKNGESIDFGVILPGTSLVCGGMNRYLADCPSSRAPATCAPSSISSSSSLTSTSGS